MGGRQRRPLVVQLRAGGLTGDPLDLLGWHCGAETVGQAASDWPLVGSQDTGAQGVQAQDSTAKGPLWAANGRRNSGPTAGCAGCTGGRMKLSPTALEETTGGTGARGQAGTHEKREGSQAPMIGGPVAEYRTLSHSVTYG